MPPPLSHWYRTAFVTGASTGLGSAFVEMLLADGVQVWGTARQTDRLAGLADRHGGAFHPIALDLRDGAAAERAFIGADQAAGGFEIVINNAGYGVFGDFAATDFAVWQEQLEVMLVNTARLAHAAVRCMRPRAVGAQWCALVNVSSIAAEFPLPFQPAYNVCKSGLAALSESLMSDYAGTNLVIVDLRPGDYRTDFERSVRRPEQRYTSVRMPRAWASFERMMRTGPLPPHAAQSLRRALRRRRGGTVRTGRLFQAVIGPFLARFGSLRLIRRVRAHYFDV